MANISQINIGNETFDIKDTTARDSLAGKQDSLTFDSSPAPNSQNPVTSEGIYGSLAIKQDLLEITSDFDLQYSTSVGDIIIWNGSEAGSYKQGHLYRILSHAGGHTEVEEVSPITFDSTPTSGSTNAVTSGGIYDALADKGATDTTITVAAASWTGASAPYTQTVNVTGILATDKPILDVVVSSTVATGVDEIEAWACITKADTGAGTITFSCYEDKPTVDLTVAVKVVR